LLWPLLVVFNIGVNMNVFEQMVKILVTYEGKPMSPRKIGGYNTGNLPH
jgi:hypothetical protein